MLDKDHRRRKFRQQLLDLHAGKYVDVVERLVPDKYSAASENMVLQTYPQQNGRTGERRNKAAEGWKGQDPMLRDGMGSCWYSMDAVAVKQSARRVQGAMDGARYLDWIVRSPILVFATASI